MVATTEIYPKRWGTGLTILLEKEVGNFHINKMRAICLFEADLNYLNQTVFAHHMTDRALEEDVIPAEQFAKRGSQANHGLLASVLFADISRAMHIPAAIESVDLANCYDSVSHPIVSIALQSFNVNVPMVKMMLGVLQKMCWHLRTSFGRSPTSFGGTDSDPSMGLGQGATSAPPAFNAQSTLMINGYKALGHGADLISAWKGIMLC